ncbi:copper resistance protein CopC (plasmid) [Rhodococcus pyridinivorans]|uniref:copper resistance CopC family protein n=1 Tax=Rhodococcus pyridinivorans TaxID=103816 RepID=UPI001FFF11F8|nr:copper resistance protein CopC [Rhodococcus pyridinivorans]UPK66479.1 copper resistance protein CopC [Rhodococcus pyridinivorans]
MRYIVTVLAAACAALLLTAGPAQAHSSLIDSTPGFDSVVDRSPEQVELVFNQNINPAFATVTVTDGGGVQHSGGEALVAGDRVSVAVPEPLSAGSYTVGYRVVSADGHPITGSYSFTVTAAAEGAGPASGATTPALPQDTPISTPTAAAVTDEPATEKQSPIALLLLAAALAVLVVAGGTWIAVRAMRRP